MTTSVPPESLWGPEQCRSYLDRWHAHISDPLYALSLAFFGKLFVDRVEATTGHEQRALRGRALTIYGSALSLVGNLAAAEDEFLTAEQWIDDAADLADLYRLWACNKMLLGELEAAVGYARRADEGFTAIGDLHGSGRAKSAWGQILIEMGLYNEAIAKIRVALQEIRPGTQSWKIADHNLTVALSESSTPENLAAALERLAEARRSDRHGRPPTRKWRRYLGRRQKTVRDTKLRWIQSRVLRRMGSDADAIALLETALEDFDALGMKLEIVGAGFDLAALYASAERWRDLHDLTARIEPLLRRIVRNPTVLAEFEFFLQAIAAEDLETARDAADLTSQALGVGTAHLLRGLDLVACA